MRSPVLMMTKWVALLALAGVCGTCSAQDIFKLFKDIGSAAASAVTASPAPPVPASPAASDSTRSTANPALASLDDLKPSSAALGELRPDTQCKRVIEDFDVLQKASDYAGSAAQLRLQTLITSDISQTELTQSDRDLLKYLAYTTVWVPIKIESSVGKLWAGLASKGSDIPEPSGRSQRKALDRQAVRLGEIRDAMDGFPGDANLVLDPKLPDSAFSRVGGLVVLSPRFLSMMDDRDGVRDVLLAHELSHLYKRHSLKALQYQLVGSAKGWNIARRLLRLTIAQSAPSGNNPFTSLFDTGKMLYENASLANDVFNFIKENQTRYSLDQELEADSCALRWLEKLAIKPADAWAAFADVLAEPGPVADATYVSMHPSPEERTQNIALFLGGPLSPRPAGGETPEAASAVSKGSQRRSR